MVVSSSSMHWLFFLLCFVPLVHAQDTLSIINPPSTIPISGNFQITVSYVATGNRAIVADILYPSQNFAWYGQGWVTVPASTSSVPITITLRNNPVPGAYVINLWEVDASIWNNGQSTEAWRSSTVTIKYNVTAAAAAAPTTIPPTQRPTQRPTTRPPTPTPTPRPTPTPTQPSSENDPSPSSPSVVPLTPGGPRICQVTDSDDMMCQGCGYTICRNSQPLYQLCEVGSCNNRTQQCDSTLPQCPAPYLNNMAPQHIISWVGLLLLSVITAFML